MKSIMKQIMLFVGTIVLSTGSFAYVSTSFGKGSTQLNALSAAIKSSHSLRPTLDKNDIEMGYGGQDIAHMPVLAL